MKIKNIVATFVLVMLLSFTTSVYSQPGTQWYQWCMEVSWNMNNAVWVLESNDLEATQVNIDWYRGLMMNYLIASDCANSGIYRMQNTEDRYVKFKLKEHKNFDFKPRLLLPCGMTKLPNSGFPIKEL